MKVIDYTAPEPAAPFNYCMRTTAVMEHSRGIAWTADLYARDVKIGTIEQDGNGGCDRVYFTETAYRTLWTLAVQAAFGGNEEDATYWLLCQEEDQS